MKIKPVRREGGAYRCDVELSDGMVVGARGGDPLAAVERTAALAEMLAKSPLVNAFLPPQATAALAAVRLAVKAARSGDVRAIAEKAGPVVARNALRVLRRLL